MNFIRRLFGGSNKIKFCGRTGLLYYKDGEEYFVESELLTGDPDIVISRERIFLNSDHSIKLPQQLKDAIALEIREELRKQKMSVDIEPFL